LVRQYLSAPGADASSPQPEIGNELTDNTVKSPKLITFERRVDFFS
jgi:hypothetical protein